MRGETKSEVMRRGKDVKGESGVELILELRVGLSFLISKLSLMRRSHPKEDEEEERIVKSSDKIG